MFWSINRASSFSFAEIIDDLANLVENTDERLRTETRRVTLVDRKSASCGERGGSEGAASPRAVASALAFPVGYCRFGCASKTAAQTANR